MDNKIISFKKIDDARKLLGFEEEATLDEIRKAFRKLSLKYHPDKQKGENKKESEEIFKKINNAKELIMRYISGCRYSFKEKDVKRQSMDKRTYKHLKRFYDDWWGKLDF